VAIWARSFLTHAGEPLSPEAVTAAVSGRLLLLTSLLCPDREEPVEAVLERMAVAADGEDAVTVRYRPANKPALRFERWRGASAKREIDEVLEEFQADAAGGTVRKVLAKGVEVIGVRLSQSDADGMGLPVALTYLSKLAHDHGGLVHVEDRGWFEPLGNEVRLIAEC